MTTVPSSSCDATRAALSAQLDREDPGLPAGQLAAHLDACVDCRQWLVRAEQVTRGLRRELDEVPDLTARIVAAARSVSGPAPAEAAASTEVAASTRVAAGSAPRSAARQRRTRWRRRLRVATVVVAAAQLVVALPALLGALGIGDDTLHVSHEAGSLDVALAVGFLLAGLRPALARAYTPVGFVLAACLILTSGLDVLQQRVTLAHETGHLVVVVQAVLVWALSRTVPVHGDRWRRPAPVGP